MRLCSGSNANFGPDRIARFNVQKSAGPEILNAMASACDKDLANFFDNTMIFIMFLFTYHPAICKPVMRNTGATPHKQREVNHG